MNYKIDTIEHFEKQAKRLNKKFISLKTEINDLIDSLEDSPFQGTKLLNGFYKI